MLLFGKEHTIWGRTTPLYQTGTYHSLGCKHTNLEQTTLWCGNIPQLRLNTYSCLGGKVLQSEVYILQSEVYILQFVHTKTAVWGTSVA